jgi:thermostable 8-oxoguanine DNA glycosylase
MNKKQRYEKVFKCAKRFLTDEMAKHDGLTETILREHLYQEARFNRIEDALQRLVELLAIRNSVAPVFGSQLEMILLGFNPKKIVEKFKSAEQLLGVLMKEAKLENMQNRRRFWLEFSEGVISSSRFMATFKDKEEFDKFIEKFSFNKYTKVALPMLLSKEIKGLSFVQACDFLKELGYRDYPTPDSHLVKIFTELGLSGSPDTGEVYKAIVEMSEAVGEDAFIVDRYFGLIATGRFYLADIKIGRKSCEFIDYAKLSLN